MSRFLDYRIREKIRKSKDENRMLFIWNYLKYIKNEI